MQKTLPTQWCCSYFILCATVAWFRRATLPLLLTAQLVSCAGDEKNSVSTDPLQQALQSEPTLKPVLDDAEEYRLQIVLGLVQSVGEGRPELRQYAFRAGAEYFYPASSIKMFAAIAAAQEIERLNTSTGQKISLDTPLIYHPLFADDVLEEDDEDNLDGGTITVRQQIREIFYVSDNQAFNYLYDLAGQDGIMQALKAAGLDDVRIVHRLEEFRTPEENRQYPCIDFTGADFSYTRDQRQTPPLPAMPAVTRIEVGQRYYAGGELVDEPMDFSVKNYIALRDLQRGLCKLVRPEVDCAGGVAFELSDDARNTMLESMSQYPQQSRNPRYDAREYPDDYVKGLLPGVARVIPREQVRIFNKTGQAYGFSIENAWVVNDASGEGFFLAATLYANQDGTLNDDQYEYETIAGPFMANLGAAVARVVFGDVRIGQQQKGQ
jgi:hypothetical protein